MKTFDSKLVGGEKLLELLFDKSCRPSMVWLAQNREKGLIPYSRVGRRVFYDPSKVYGAMFETKIAAPSTQLTPRADAPAS